MVQHRSKEAPSLSIKIYQIFFLALVAYLALFALLFSAPLIAADASFENVTDDSSASLNLLKVQIDQQSHSNIDATAVFTIHGNDLPWLNTDIDLEEGQFITFLLDGELDFGAPTLIPPGVAFWAGFGEERPMYVPGRNTNTIEVPQSGRLYLARSLTEWDNQEGDLNTPVADYQAVQGTIDVLVIVWNEDPQISLSQLIDRGLDNSLLLTEAQRIKTPFPVPEEWHYMWLFGNNGIFQPGDNNQQINVFTHNDVGILQTDVDIALTPETNITWDWIVEQLPSAVAEDQAFSHDYLSLAIEFDDGQDLSYIWSSTLEADHHFRCPLPRWAPFETHYVIHGSQESFGQWEHESRNIYSDYNAMIGGSAKRITKVWLIANSIFQNGFGQASFRNILIKNGEISEKVL